MKPGMGSGLMGKPALPRGLRELGPDPSVEPREAPAWLLSQGHFSSLE